MKLQPWFMVGVFLVALFTGTLVLSIGVGSAITSINTVMSPLVCPGDVIVPAWKYRGKLKLAAGPDLRTRWICMNETTGEAHVAGYRTIVTAGTVYALVITIAFLLSMRILAARKQRKAVR